MKKRNIVLIVILICLIVIGSVFAYIECKEEPLAYNAVVLKRGFTNKEIFTSEFKAENDIDVKNHQGWGLIISDKTTYDKVFSYDYNVDFNSHMIVVSFYRAWDESSVRIKSISRSGETLIITEAEEVSILENCKGKKGYGTPTPHILIIKLDKLDVTKVSNRSVLERVL